jgi:nucleoside-diphosphate-sugar epimerase
MMKRVLVTGATGFIGSHLSAYLRTQGYIAYRGVRSLGPDSDSFDVTCDLGDLSSISNLANENNFDVIVHLASTVGWNGQSYEEMFLSNVIATGVLAKVANQMGAMLIFASAALVHGKASALIDNVSPIILDTNYARTKYDAELLLKLILPSACILRIGGVFGENGPSHLGLNRSIIAAIGGKPPILFGAGDSLRNYIYVDDLCMRIERAISMKASGTFLVAGGEPVSMRYMCEAISKVFLNTTDVISKPAASSVIDQVIIGTDIFGISRKFIDVLRSIKMKSS